MRYLARRILNANLAPPKRPETVVAFKNLQLPPPIAVELAKYDSTWPSLAALHSGHLAVLGDLLLAVHHIGSTSISGILAKPIIDLLSVVTNLELLEQRRTMLERLGYQWHGEYGLPGRRYCLLEDAAGGRIVQAHFFEAGSFEIARHLAFRDHLRDHPTMPRSTRM